MNEQSFIILGGGGDLAKRLLIPGIGQYANLFRANLGLVGADMAEEIDYPSLVSESFATAGIEGEQSAAMAGSATYEQVDATSAEDMTKLLAGKKNPVLYFALPPTITQRALEVLKEIELPDGLIVALEKPIGDSATTAREVNELLVSLLPEEQIFRVDHFLGMSATINIGTLRDDNRIIDPVWNNEHLDEIRIVFNETLGLEGRAAFYDKTGATIDMIHSHLIQVMAHTLADATDGPDEILKATTATSVRRGRYTAGSVNGRQLPSYANEEGVAPESTTETWARVEMAVDTDRWRGVPILLESGKAIGNPRQEITATFKTENGTTANKLRLAFESDDLLLELNVADPAQKSPARVSLASGLVPSQLGAYGRVAAGILQHQEHMKLSGEASEQGWRILEPVLESFDQYPLEEYEAGTTPGTGPVLESF